MNAIVALDEGIAQVIDAVLEEALKCPIIKVQVVGVAAGSRREGLTLAELLLICRDRRPLGRHGYMLYSAIQKGLVSQNPILYYILEYIVL